MNQYKELIKNILENGTHRPDRTGTGTKSIFGYQNRYNLLDGLPLVTIKKLFTRGIIEELLWILRGETNIIYLVDRNVKIWDDDAYKHYLKINSLMRNSDVLTQDEFIGLIKESISMYNERDERMFHLAELTNKYMGRNASCDYIIGDLGDVYGAQFRGRNKTPNYHYHNKYNVPKWRDNVDQLLKVINGLRNNPFGRRHIISSWNVNEIEEMALPPCHTLSQFYVTEMTEEDNIKYKKYYNDLDVDIKIIPKYKLSCQLYQRSADVGLGVPFNIASYSILTHFLADLCGFAQGDFIHTFGDAHIYNDHIETMEEILKNEPHELPKLLINYGDNRELIRALDVEKSLKSNNESNILNRINAETFEIHGYTSNKTYKMNQSS